MSCTFSAKSDASRLLSAVRRAVQFPDRTNDTAKPRPVRDLPPLDPSQAEVLSACSVQEPVARFALWLVEDLNLPHERNDGVCRVTIPEDQTDQLDGRHSVAFCVDHLPPAEGHPEAGTRQPDFPGAGSRPCDRLTVDDSFFQWLARRVRTLHEQSAGALDSRPCHDPRGVYELTERLFSRYRVDGGSVHLSGCTLEDRPFLRLTYPARDDAAEVRHLYFTPDGTPVDADSRESLGLADLCHAAPPQHHPADSQVELLVAAGRRVIESHVRVTEALQIGASDQPLAATIVWVKRAAGKLQFTMAEESADVAFDGWARTLEPPPYVCPHTGTRSYHLAATDDGRIAAAEAIEPCAQSGRRVLSMELVTCSVTGKRVLPQFTRTCPVTGKPALAEEFDECSQCHQRVSRAALSGGVCEGCRSLAPAHRDDPRVVWFLGEFERLGQWGRWKLSETASHFIVMGSRLFGRILIVFDKETLAPQYAATRGRFRTAWLPLDPTEQQDLFGERAMERPE